MVRRRHWIAALLAAGLSQGGAGRALAQLPPHWPRAVTLATASPGGTYHAYGAGLARQLKAAGIPVVEVERPKRRHLRPHGKSDPVASAGNSVPSLCSP